LGSLTSLTPAKRDNRPRGNCFPSQERHLIIVTAGRSIRVQEGGGMEKFIARENITHLREKLATEQDEAKRQILLRLLAEQEAKLTTLENDPSKKKKPAD
jgi:hypothetical protein